QPREERGSIKGSNRASLVMSAWIDLDNKHLTKESGYQSFPFIVYRWSKRADSPYSESPIMLCMQEIKRLQVLERDLDRGVSKATNPPIATPADLEGALGRPLNLNPGANNKGYLDPTRGLLARPIDTTQPQALGFVMQVQQLKREQIKDALYIPLFQALMQQTQQMTAREVLERAQEKSDMLGPAGASFESSLSSMVDRELVVLSEKGAFGEGAALQMPQSLTGANVIAQSTSPLNRMRRSNELNEADAYVGRIAQLQQMGHEDAGDYLDTGAYLDLARDIGGAPANLRPGDDIIEQRRGERQKQADQAQQMAMAQSTAAIAKDAVPAAEQLNDIMGKQVPPV
ncbi:MAG: hypothetical protein JKY49_07305, partial [Cohaesibacteraceae bacterium]|nr:hypothetical protein [Cohaesibacteraceae bacterium]MBL4874986.1 hypothetical protein [Cohaesibacteraceae bacterium]